MSFFQTGTKDNTNNSRIWSLVTILFLLVGAALPWITNHVVLYNNTGFNISLVLLAIATYVTAKVGIKNTVATNDSWKTGVQVASAFANIVVPMIFIVSYANQHLQ